MTSHNNQEPQQKEPQGRSTAHLSRSLSLYSLEDECGHPISTQGSKGQGEATEADDGRGRSGGGSRRLPWHWL
jgi:hypothetical protein